VTVAELLIAAGITVTVVATTVGVATSVQEVFDSGSEVTDMQQRLRAAADALARDLAGAVAPVMPYGGPIAHDPVPGMFHRGDAVTLLSASWEDGRIASRTFYLRRTRGGLFELRRHDGGGDDFPLLDGISLLRFDYFDSGGAPIEPASMVDGPWFPDETDANRFDTDLLRIRRVRVTLRVEPRTTLRRLEGREIRFDVSPRNFNRE
jgi:hypothetical protein